VNVWHGLWTADDRLAVWGEGTDAAPFPGEPATLTLLLPTVGGRRRPSPELFDPSASPSGPVVLEPAKVDGFTYDADEAVGLLRALRDAGLVLGASLRHLVAAAAFADDLTARGRVVPTIEGSQAVWRPVLTGEDRHWAQTLLQALPPSAYADATSPEEMRRPDVVLSRMLDNFVDASARARLRATARPGRAKRPKDALGAWRAALTGSDREIAAAPSEVERLAREIGHWQRDAAAGPVRALFRLIEPPPPPIDLSDPDAAVTTHSDEPWKVELSLQSADEPSLVVPADQIWRARSGLKALQRHLDAPQETFLAELGRAARLWPDLDKALGEAKPAVLDLDASGAHAFLREAAPLLAGAGFGVLLPSWWGRPAARLGAKLSAKSPTAPGTVANASSLGFDAIVDYEWQLALGDHTLSAAELRRLAKLKAPLVRVRGQWVELDPKHLAAGLALMADKGQMTVLDLLQGAAAAQADIPILDVTATGWLGDLLATERIAPAEISPDFTGVLRPYQHRGVSWLSFLERLGLGAILADDMGLGKCLNASMYLFVNGTLARAEDIWKRYASDEIYDGEGYWTEPTAPLIVNAINDSGQIVQAPIRRLYRQHITEPMRRVRLDDGSEVMITRRHKLLKANGWTTNFEVGDRLCVPARLDWAGEPVDPDLTKLLAWQIAEGDEPLRGALRITQKDRRVLDDLMALLPEMGKRWGFEINRPSIIFADRGAHRLRLNSVSYTAFLEAKGYQWGRRSADKSIPDFIVAADDETVKLFLREYFTAEGSVLRTGVVEISSASTMIMDQLSTMLRRFGIWLRFQTKMKHATNGTGIRRPYRVGIIGGPSLRRFAENIGFSDAKKEAKLEWLCGVAANTNVEGVPGFDLLRAAADVTRLPQRHFGVGTVYFTGTQELSRETAGAAVLAMDRMLSGQAADEYRLLPRSKWTGTITAAYDQLDRAALQNIRDAMAQRTASEVFYARIVEIEDVDYSGWVYDFEVHEHHNFVAGGVLCHNTVQLLAAITKDAVKTGPTLLICPMSLVGNWQREAAKFTPTLRVHVHHGAERAQGKKFTEAVAAADLVVTTYALAARDAAALRKIEWHRVVVDEAQAIKNAATRQATAVRSLPARHKIAVTGTPVENRLADLWSLMEFTNPGLLGPAAEFKRAYAEPIQRHNDEQAAERLRRLTGPFVLRRLKTDKTIISDLPEKLEMEVVCNLTGEQATLYQAVVDEAMAAIERSDGIERKGLVLATMTRLKQVCNHPAQFLRDGSRLEGRSGKLARLEEIVEEILAAGEKALLFTQYAEFGGSLQAYLTARFGREVLYLHGGVSKSDRDAMVARFQNTDAPGPALFVLSLKAGGTGLTLTAANHVIHVDRWWNPAVEDQATDRAFRIGQKRAVQVRKFVCAGTLEEKISAMIADKRDLAARIVGTGEGWITELGTSELRDLFALQSSAVVE
jgi:hypothetical protein